MMNNSFVTKTFDIIEGNSSKELNYSVDINGISVINDGSEDMTITLYFNNPPSDYKDQISFTVKTNETFEEVFYTTFNKINIEAHDNYRIILRI